MLAALRLFSHRLAAEALLDYAEGREMSGPRRAALERLLQVLPHLREEVALLREGLAAVRAELPAFSPPGRASQTWRRLALAASLLAALGIGGLAWSWHRYEQQEARVARLEERLNSAASGEATDEPRVGLTLVDAFPAALVLRGDEGAGETVRLSPEAGQVVLLLNSRLADKVTVEQLVIVDAAGEELWSWQGTLARGSAGEFVVELPVAQVGQGDFAIHLYVRRDGHLELAETYRLRIG